MSARSAATGHDAAAGPRQVAMAADDRLSREARVLTRYILSAECPPEIAERYARAARLRDAWSATDDVTAFALAHPWSIALLDAAGALTGGATGLRARLHLMTAILEASPRFADAFLPLPTVSLATLARAAALGAVGVAKAVVGLPLLFVVGRNTR